ncbi:hypothetical protein JW935_21850 [candidate division KSB1 bacterium]|nr:hypothetical protein [candidate division KSB1 bacterium]
MNDVTVYRYQFFSQWHATDDTMVRQHNWNTIWEQIEKGYSWLNDQAGLNERMPIRQIPDSGQGRQKSRRLAGTDWLPELQKIDDQNGNRSFLIEARSIHDSTYIQLAAMRHGESSSDDVFNLYECFENYGAPMDDENVLKLWMGQVTCLYAEISGIFNVETDGLELFYNLTECEEIPNVITFEWGVLLCPAPDMVFNQSFYTGGRKVYTCQVNPEKSRPHMLILVRRDEASLYAGSWFVNYILPRLSLSFLKINLAYQIYEYKIPALDEAEQKLAHILKGQVCTENLRALERKIIIISGLLDDLIENMGNLRHRVLGIQANLKNLEFILNDDVVKHKYQDMWRLFGEHFSLSGLQIKVDLDYYQTRNDEAQLTLQTLQSLIDVERGKNERLMVAVLGIVGLVLSLIDGFSDEFSSITKAAIVAGGVLVGLLIYWYSKRVDRID